MHKSREESYKTYLDERRHLIESDRSAAEQFDKALLTLSAGALGLSITFINQIAPNPEAETLWLVIVAWILFCCSVLSTLLSKLLAQSAYKRQVGIDERYLLGEAKQEAQPPESNRLAIAVTLSNFFSLTLFIGGVAFLILFTSANLSATGGS